MEFWSRLSRIWNVSTDKREAPSLDGVDWINGKPTSLKELRGEVVLLEFWSYGCSWCRDTIPHLQRLHERYSDEEFQVLGIHTPEHDYEKDPEKVSSQVEELGVRWPVALDPERTLWRRYDNSNWPSFHIIDKESDIRYSQTGRGRYGDMERTIEALLRER